MLIKASSATTLIIEGEHLFERRQWIAPSFNLTGFDVDPNEPPTFARFFDGSRAHEELNVFKLIDGTWRKVSAQETMRRGEAYWVWCKEGTGFQGPVDLNISSGNELTIEATSNGALPVTLTVNAADQSTLPLHSIRRRRISVPISSVTDSLLVQGGGMRFSISLPVDPNES